MRELNIERRELQFKKEEYKKLETQYNKSLKLIKNKIIRILHDGTNELPKMDNLQNIISLSSENITLDGSNLELIISDAKDIEKI